MVKRLRVRDLLGGRDAAKEQTFEDEDTSDYLSALE
jgi:hypothetical protein